MSLPTADELITYADGCSVEDVYAALRRAILRIDGEIRTSLECPVPAGMLRVYVWDEIACTLRYPGHQCLLDHDEP